MHDQIAKLEHMFEAKQIISEEQNFELSKSKKQLEEDYTTRIQTLNKKISENKFNLPN